MVQFLAGTGIYFSLPSPDQLQGYVQLAIQWVQLVQLCSSQFSEEQLKAMDHVPLETVPYGVEAHLITHLLTNQGFNI